MPRPQLHRWILPVAAEWLAIAVLFALGVWAASLWVWFAVTVLVGCRQHALSVLGHEGTHYAVIRSSRLNDLFTCLFAFWPLGVGLTAYRRFHFAHHRHVGTDADPERLHKHVWSKSQWQLPMALWRIVLYCVGDCLGFGILEVIKAIKLIGKANLVDVLGPFVWWGLIFAPFALLGLWQIPLVWFVALFTSFWAFMRLRIWTEHVGTDATNVVQPNWLERTIFLPWNVWLHPEHHAHPRVPQWALPELRREQGQTVGGLLRTMATVR